MIVARSLCLGTLTNLAEAALSIRGGSRGLKPAARLCQCLLVVGRGRDGFMKAEQILAKLNELRHDAEDDKTDIEYLTLHHAFCFLSYRMSDFQAYLDEVAKQE
jgi:hypothetical protein